MISDHLWFRSGPYSLLAHLDQPKTTLGETGLLIVPPFGWEDICSYRPLRSLGRSLALAGIPSFRYDLPGTGDSSGSALDSELIEAWIQSVTNAALEFKAKSGVQRVSVLGIRLGALLGLAAASIGAPVHDLMLWGGELTGHALLRELRAMRSLEYVMYSDGEKPPPQPIPGTEILGFLLNPETARKLELLNLAPLPTMSDRRVMLLSRDGFPAPKSLVQELERCGCKTVQKVGAGYSAMMAFPHPELPSATRRVIVDFLSEGRTAKGRAFSSVPIAPAGSQLTFPESGVSEKICLLPDASGNLFSIMAQPAEKGSRSEWCLLLLNAGLVRHIGSNRMWVETARRAALNGISSLRLDFDHIGESDGGHHLKVASLFEDRLVEQIEAAINFVSAQIGCKRFLALGLCSGAYGAFQGLIQNSSIEGAILLNPRIFFWDPAIDERRLQRAIVSRMAGAADWRRLLRGEIDRDRVKLAGQSVFNKLMFRERSDHKEPQISREKMSSAWSIIQQRQSQMTLIFSNDEPLFEEMVEEQQLPAASDPLVRCLQMGRSGHTFQPLWAQKLLREVIDAEIERILGKEEYEGASRSTSPLMSFEITHGA